MGLEVHQHVTESWLWQRFADQHELTVPLAQKLFGMWEPDDYPTFTAFLRSFDA